MKKCHSEHMKVSKNKIKVTVTFDSNEMYIPIFLANKYSEGCVADFIHEVMINAFRNDFAEDFQAVTAPREAV